MISISDDDVIDDRMSNDPRRPLGFRGVQALREDGGPDN